jgi:mono/diheme cytochrome c family protein
MPAFNHLESDEIAAIGGHVRTLAWAGTYNRLVQKAAESGDVEPSELLEIADRQSTPGEPLAIPEVFVSTNESIAHGRQVYTTVCASCHGPEGKGDGPQVKELKNEDGTPTRPRDLTSGVFKGGRDPAQIYSRIMLGMPGTPMPASSQLPTKDITSVLSYVLSLSEPGPP